MLTVYWCFLASIALERLLELAISRRNAAWAMERGGIELGAGHFPFMAALHTGLLIAAAAEPYLLDRAFVPALGYPMIGLALISQMLRYWVISTLGRQWNVKVIVIPGAPRIRRGPFRFFKHPNYVAVVIEGLALPLIFSGYFTAVAFTVLNAGLLYVRIGVEERALQKYLTGESAVPVANPKPG